MATRRIDVLVRRGGEEFLLLMPGASGDQARVIAERVRANVGAGPIAIGEKRVAQTVSIGVATWDGKESAARLEKKADRACTAPRTPAATASSSRANASGARRREIEPKSR